ncbi:TetR/AcrR family transcriptional regulator [Acidaminobacter sp. JC074]|uniref:TetR family transcriptional regulator n=1 Tax=Acidaminobacter sp. JC074 TaxID=2530199 RepID=UPI001F105A95|nr:TetR family transcriptional regulator [Acidaminobacter sp. JC074]MCH4886406.1 TetR/AcrR family transcriptional regulator [Acidaminobacter sp. JC074]
MTFQRARSDEQKDKRIQEIISAAKKLYTTMDFEEITLTKIAEELSFSRINLYKYFKTIEEIYLKVLLLDLEDFIQELEKSIHALKNVTVEDFTYKFIEVLTRNKRLLHLLTIDLSLLEKKATAEKLRSHKSSVMVISKRITDLLSEVFPSLTDDQTIHFVNSVLFYSRGLYSANNASELQHEIYNELNCRFLVPDYDLYLSEFSILQLRHLLNKKT